MGIFQGDHTWIIRYDHDLTARPHWRSHGYGGIYTEIWKGQTSMNRNDFRRFWGFNTRILRVVEWIQDQRWNPSDLGSFDRIILGMLGQSGIIKSGTICGTMFGRCMMLFPPKHPKTIALYVCIYILWNQHLGNQAQKPLMNDVNCRSSTRALRKGGRREHGPKWGPRIENWVSNFWIETGAAQYGQQGHTRWYMCFRQCKPAAAHGHDTVCACVHVCACVV